MAILNYTTSISSEKTIGEIQSCLAKHGAKKVVVDYSSDGLPMSVTFCLILNGQLQGFCLPANYGGVLNSMKRDRKIAKRLCTDEQALKVSWRIVKDWVEAQMAIVEAQIAQIEEVFLPYAVMKTGNTLYKELSQTNFKLLV